MTPIELTKVLRTLARLRCLCLSRATMQPLCPSLAFVLSVGSSRLQHGVRARNKTDTERALARVSLRALHATLDLYTTAVSLNVHSISLVTREICRG